MVIKLYHTDNGIFNASEFMEELLKKQQKIIFIGAGASHKNGAAELLIYLSYIVYVAINKNHMKEKRAQ